MMDSNLKKNILLILCYINLSFASTTIDQQIEAIKNAPADQRVQMMNNLKRQLILMNQEERQQTIHKLRQNAPQTSPIHPQTPIRVDRNIIEYHQLQQDTTRMLNTQESQQIIINNISEDRIPEVKIPEQTPEIKTPEVKIPEQTP